MTLFASEPEDRHEPMALRRPRYHLADLLLVVALCGLVLGLVPGVRSISQSRLYEKDHSVVTPAGQTPLLHWGLNGRAE